MDKDRKPKHLRIVDNEFSTGIPQRLDITRWARFSESLHRRLARLASTDIDQLRPELRAKILARDLSDCLLAVRSNYDPEANHDIAGYKLLKGLHETAILATVFRGDVEAYTRVSVDSFGETQNESALLFDTWSTIKDIHSIPPDSEPSDLIQAAASPIWLHENVRAPLVVVMEKTVKINTALADQAGMPVHDFLGQVQAEIARKGMGLDPDDRFYDEGVEVAVGTARKRWLQERRRHLRQI